MILAFDDIENFPVYILDELDHAFDQENLANYMKILKYLKSKSQIFFTSFKKEILNLDDMLILCVEFDNKSRIRIVDDEYVKNIFTNSSN